MENEMRLKQYKNIINFQKRKYKISKLLSGDLMGSPRQATSPPNERVGFGTFDSVKIIDQNQDFKDDYIIRHKKS